MMAAISASYGNQRVILFEKNEKPGKKLYITGKGRCNITNACPPADFLNSVVTNPRFMYSSFSDFTNEDMVAFLNDRGLATKVERGQRVFPRSDHSSDVIRILVEEMKKCHVDVRTGCSVKKLLLEGESPRRAAGVVLSDGQIVKADAVILTCGGKSYPSTGSNGSGYDLAAQAGHRIMEPQPSLVPFNMKESWCRDLSGLSLKNVSLTLKEGKKKIYQGFGEFLFTHFGVSGPLVLTASTCLGKHQEALRAGKLILDLDLKPALSQDQLDRRFLREFDIYRNKKIGNVIERMLPKSMVAIFLNQAQIDQETRVRDITKKERRRMVETMKQVRMHIRGTRGFEEAIITRGGVCVREVNPRTMESKLVKNLYIAGELLDVDAVTGGFNLQVAWSTGYAAGKNA